MNEKGGRLYECDIDVNDVSAIPNCPTAGSLYHSLFVVKREHKSYLSFAASAFTSSPLDCAVLR